MRKGSIMVQKASSEFVYLDDYQRERAPLRRKRLGGYPPRWLAYVLRRTQTEQFRLRAQDAGIYLMNESCYSGLFDHWGEDLQGRLLTEPYGEREVVERLAKLFAKDHELEYSVEPEAFHAPMATRVVFWPKNKWNIDLETGRVRES